MAVDELGIDRDPAEVPDELGITRPSAPARPTAHTDGYGITYDASASSRPPALTNDGGPTRPYSSPGQLGGNAPRSQEFSTGTTGETNAGNIASIRHQAPDPGLNLSSQQFNSQVTGYRPSSVLQGIGKNPGGLGMSEGDAERRLPTGEYLGSINATSADGFSPSTMLRLATGQDSI